MLAPNFPDILPKNLLFYCYNESQAVQSLNITFFIAVFRNGKQFQAYISFVHFIADISSYYNFKRYGTLFAAC